MDCAAAPSVSGPAELDAWLQAGAGSGEAARRVHDTPIARVYVFGDRVLKLKKPVDFGFLDFTTCAKRAWATRRELDFNRRIAPDVYRTIHAVVRSAHGLVLADPEHAAGDVLDHVLEMRPFKTEVVLSDDPDQVDGELAERLGREVARIQSKAPTAGKDRGAAALDYVLRSNADQLRSLAPMLGASAVESLISRTRAEFERLATLLDARRDAGFVRRCHGDLHLGNIVVEDGRPILFDCIEFNDVLSEVDVGYDIAFLMMDLAHRGRTDAANRVLNAWLDEAGRDFGEARLAGLAAMPLFQSVRAAVRVHVNGHGGKLEAARRYLDTAAGFLDRSTPRLFAIGGLSGSGKSTLARALAPHLCGPPGAAVLRTDEIRKRLAGVPPTQRLAAASYTPQMSRRVYGVMMAEARRALRAGVTVVLDAAFLKADERRAAEALAKDMGVEFSGCWMQAKPAALRDRLRCRKDDASDADEAVLDRQLKVDLGEIGWRPIDTDQGQGAQIATALS